MGARACIAAMIVAIGGATLTGCIPQGSGPSAAPRHTSAAPPAQPDRARAPATRELSARELPVRELPARARRVVADARAVAATRYIVQPGDTLPRIAERTGTGADAIIRANAMVSPYIVHPGQQLAIPGNVGPRSRLRPETRSGREPIDPRAQGNRR